MTTMSSREFNQDAGKAKRLAMQKITATHLNMADMLGCPESAEIDFEPTPLQKTLFANVDLS